ncbi:MAG: amino acid ABC transporter permease [Anaerolineae bacterium]|nr:amino acid ABC transporter permease [Anaerolineae bacterium]
MATTTKPSQKSSNPRHIHFNFNQWVSDHITHSWLLMFWLLILTVITFRFTVSRLEVSPVTTIIVLVAWAVSVAVAVYAELIHRHTAVTLWMRNNLYNSITNVQLTLIISLGILAVIFGLFNYAITTASFLTTPTSDLRAEVSSQTADTFCFTVGAPDDETGALTHTEERCYPRWAFVPELSETVITEVTLGMEAAQFCFDTEREDAENGRACFESTAANPALFTIALQFSGANWGAVWANLVNMMVFRYNRAELWRVAAAGIFGVSLAVASIIVYRDSFKNKRIRQALTYIWLASPIIFYVLLAGVQPVTLSTFFTEAIPYVIALLVALALWQINKTVNFRHPPQMGESEWIRLGRIVLTLLTGIAAFFGFISAIVLIMLVFGLFKTSDGQVFVPVNPDVDWGGFMLTLIITAFAIVVSFPLGIMLALGRRSTIYGIPNWVTYPIAIVIMIWGLLFSTPILVENARNNFELLLAYWPLTLPLFALLFQRVWKGNVVAGFCTIYIEFIRGIPLITVLFLSIILFPIFLPPEMEFLKTWRVMWAFALFAAAYLAENVRGGLQAIPKGQYEAADSLGLSTVSKYRLIIMPQALRTVIPAITNQYIGLFKDTTLVAIVGLLDILGVANSIAAQPQWLGVRREAYLFIAILYFIISAIIAGYSARVEKQTGLGER